MFYEKIAIAISAFALAAGAVNAAHSNWTSEAREPVHHIFMNASDRTLDVDDVNGTIEVTGDTGNTIRVEGEKIMRAADAQALDRARKEVTLDINEKEGVAQLYVNGPFRNNGHSSEDHGFHTHSDDHDYEVTYNLTIRVPRATELHLRDSNGEIKTAETSEFHSVNGAIEAAFPAALSADLSFKTLNGQVYTDFEAKALADSPGSGERRNGKFVYASNRSSSVRIGSGGPELNFETVNGDIRIRKEPR
jgi:DUF4097 and DUF4098 domain-containing protein YvlB